MIDVLEFARLALPHKMSLDEIEIAHRMFHALKKENYTPNWDSFRRIDKYYFLRAENAPLTVAIYANKKIYITHTIRERAELAQKENIRVLGLVLHGEI